MSVNYGSILDTRDLEKRIDELEALKDAIAEAECAVKEGDQEDEQDLRDELESAQEAFDSAQEWDKELEELQSARDEVSEWIDGETLIPRSEWTDHCREIVSDCVGIPKNLPSYIKNNINWDGVASDLETDYGSLTLDGTEYLYRE